MKKFILFIGICICVQLVKAQEISLAGEWRFAIDAMDSGIGKKWFATALPDKIILPGSMAENSKGNDITLKTKWTGSIYDSSFYFNPKYEKYHQPGNIYFPFWLTPSKYYVGAAWYQKMVRIPANWKGKRIVLFLERAHIETRLWIDDKEIGLQNSLVAAHQYDVSKYLHPGIHRITVCVDNRLKVNVGVDSHSVTDHTQGNWNGLVGKLNLQASSPVYFEDIQIFPDLKKKQARVRLVVKNASAEKTSGRVSISAQSFNCAVNDKTAVFSKDFSLSKGEIDTLVVAMTFDDNMQVWDEFNPALYRLTASLKIGNSESSTLVQFGMREFKTDGKKFLINGRPVFLRGTLHNCEFPLTGYPATDVGTWERLFKIAKAHGLNHIRFHSWCPPEAAFIAADIVGLYIQPEGPSWPNHGVKIGMGEPIDQYLYDETNRMAKSYGNYASFVMLSAGNEPAGNQVNYLNEFVDYWKSRDNRRVYTGMSVGGSWPVVPHAEYLVRGGIRGLAWDAPPETMSDFSEPISKFIVPFVAHEIGQYCAFPDFDAIKKYTGVYRAKNFEMFQQDLADHGMLEQAHDFLVASGKLQALCYKHEIEKMLRTPEYAGFQLLGLQDFPGQGTALVGILDAFWDEKGYISAKAFARFCNATVPLARLSKFVFTNNESFEARIDIFHSGHAPIRNAVLEWVIKDEKGKLIANGQFNAGTIAIGNGIPIGQIQLPLSAVTKPSRLNLEVSLKNTAFVNDWDFWVYPANLSIADSGVYYTTQMDERAKSVLENGGKVFLNAAGKVIKGKEVAMHFLPVFWNTSWFQMKPPHVTGMLIQDQSKAFTDFPTSGHADLQWWAIQHRSQVMVLEDFPKGFKPLVQPIDTWFINRRLGLILEARVGKGKIIVSSANLNENANDPAAKQLYYSLLKYMASNQFNPKDNVRYEVIKDLFVSPSREQYRMYTADSPEELKPK
ncbi:exo-beta-1,4-galactosidase [Pinibacter soli]|uniref:beta-galactosidase n=1 Tax=Pinibacter soli TaxID=3044211 RepID=A0ABT6RA85_9BACT|nr:sugar-binding domain-containing protein [Pinibacter soli]MDI3319423.1 glycoside hydrolase family 2 TIM barrel-domain containing protein [Pinibacter soli]